MKKIGIFLNNKSTSMVDVSNLKNGNPGMGGTQFEFFILISELKKRNLYDLYFFGTAKQEGLLDVKTIVVNDVYEAFNKCNELKIDLLISRDGGSDKIDILKNTKLIYWVHNYLPFEFCKIVGKNNKVKRVVFVSYQHRDFYLEMDIAKKADVIFNAFYLPKRITVKKNKTNSVIFIGNIVPIKKLHIVTKIWPKIIKEVPNAELIVIGNGQTANRTKKLGSFNIAEENYEKLILSPLLKTNTLDSVKFLGVLGAEKSEVIRKAKVAIAPNDKETFCISALEYCLAGVPTIGVAKGGLNDVVINKKSGILCKTEKGITKNVIKVLKNKIIFDELPNSIKYFKENFAVEVFIKKWISVINDVLNNVPPKKINVRKPYGDKFKFVGIQMKFLRRCLKLPDGFSRVGIVSKISRYKKHG